MGIFLFVYHKIFVAAALLPPGVPISPYLIIGQPHGVGRQPVKHFTGQIRSADGVATVRINLVQIWTVLRAKELPGRSALYPVEDWYLAISVGNGFGWRIAGLDVVLDQVEMESYFAVV
jgi:hypothetical protein